MKRNREEGEICDFKGYQKKFFKDIKISRILLNILAEAGLYIERFGS